MQTFCKRKGCSESYWGDAILPAGWVNFLTAVQEAHRHHPIVARPSRTCLQFPRNSNPLQVHSRCPTLPYMTR